MVKLRIPKKGNIIFKNDKGEVIGWMPKLTEEMKKELKKLERKFFYDKKI